MATELATNGTGHTRPGVPAIIETMDALKSIRTFIAEEFVDGIDYGAIPGTGKIKGKDGKDHERKVLLLPGAQKACMFFNCFPDTEEKPRELGEGHVEYLVKSTLVSRTTGMKVGMGTGSCSTMESKYRFRSASRTCPQCGKDAILTSKNPGEGYFCWRKKDGCGMNFAKGDPAIENQVVGKVENENPHDMRNTVLKMAVKRATVAAALGLGCLTELFTQDIDETFDITASHTAAVDVTTQATPEPESRNRDPKAKPAESPQAPASGPTKNDFIKWAEEETNTANKWWRDAGNPGKVIENHWQLIRALGRAAEEAGVIGPIHGLQPGAIIEMLLNIPAGKVKATAKKYLYNDKPAELACQEPGARG